MVEAQRKSQTAWEVNYVLQNIYHLLTESEVISGNSQTEALMYRSVITSRMRS